MVLILHNGIRLQHSAARTGRCLTQVSTGRNWGVDYEMTKQLTEVQPFLGLLNYKIFKVSNFFLVPYGNASLTKLLLYWKKSSLLSKKKMLL